MYIREMTLEDLDEVSLVEAKNFSMPWSRKGFEDALTDGNSKYVVCIEDEKIVGLCGYIQSFNEADITNVSVLKEYRGRGFAFTMLEKLIEIGTDNEITDFSLEVRVGNSDARHVYEKLGFVCEGIRPGFYDNPKEDAAIYWRR